jgi:hypothetical protein
MMDLEDLVASALGLSTQAKPVQEVVASLRKQMSDFKWQAERANQEAQEEFKSLIRDATRDMGEGLHVHLDQIVELLWERRPGALRQEAVDRARWKEMQANTVRLAFSQLAKILEVGGRSVSKSKDPGLLQAAWDAWGAYGLTVHELRNFDVLVEPWDEAKAKAWQVLNLIRLEQEEPEPRTGRAENLISAHAKLLELHKHLAHVRDAVRLALRPKE